jgi:hypothetical protein
MLLGFCLSADILLDILADILLDILEKNERARAQIADVGLLFIGRHSLGHF